MSDDGQGENGHETWRDIAGYEGYYQVSDQGRVRSVDRVITDRRQTRFFPGKMLNPTIQRSGHYYVRLSTNDGRTRTASVHRLVAFAFVPGWADGLEVCHNDGNPANNFYKNLRWDTRSENLKDIARHGRLQPRPTYCKNGHPFAGENLRIDTTRAGYKIQRCRTCHRENDRRSREKRRAARFGAK